MIIPDQISEAIKEKIAFFTINKDLKSRLKQFAYENNCTLFVPLLSAYSILLSKKFRSG